MVLSNYKVGRQKALARGKHTYRMIGLLKEIALVVPEGHRNKAIKQFLLNRGYRSTELWQI